MSIIVFLQILPCPAKKSLAAGYPAIFQTRPAHIVQAKLIMIVFAAAFEIASKSPQKALPAAAERAAEAIRYPL